MFGKRGKKRKIFETDKKGIVSDYLPWILIAVAMLVILMIAIFVLKIQGVSLIEKIKGILG